ncbi:D-glycero-beta-D-manno-heptose 1,7-bisphosphate 7-phosphatase [Larsenimonas salina]|uniref:D-glycero-beta-D-manno-heptose 1,7-bisphosphate 7-phosphatase n=1 Tax=Larsenimonas salina TaxID=1295565 RepID=UPI002072AA38|nr:D-glycero-beta-D-manno-heptose 1,7-bisphosphate 7-phosphatase [Larsenimonas salina]MCM5704663.1 D-glycero-beta-D-manno-heptose 1,7-bisphosphate 7-phosphatase [Larsenimonas salina]
MGNLIILDRDGTINEDSASYIKSSDEWQPIPGSIEAIARLSQAGHTIAIATNQSGLARGLFDEAALAAMHTKMTALIEDAGGRIAHIAYCPHGPDDQCECRKPGTGLLENIRDHLGYTTLNNSWMVGDTLRDLQAGEAMGCRLALVKTGKGKDAEKELTALRHPSSVVVSRCLQEFADTLIANTHQNA